MDIISQGIGYVSMKFSDGSCKTIRTSLNSTVLSEYGVEPRVGYLFDIDRKSFIKFREDAVSVEVTESFPEYGDEVLKFASRFI